MSQQKVVIMDGPYRGRAGFILEEWDFPKSTPEGTSFWVHNLWHGMWLKEYQFRRVRK